MIRLETWPYTAQEKLVFWASFSIFSQPSGCCHHLHIAKSAVTLHPSPDPDFGAQQFYGVHSVTTGKTEYAHKDGSFFALYNMFFLQPQHFSNLLCSFPSFRPSGKDTCTCSRARHGKTHCPHIGPHTCPAMPCVLPILSLVFRVVPPSVAEGSNKKRGSGRKKPSSAGQRNNKEKHSARSKEKRTQSNKKRTGERRCFFLLSLSLSLPLSF